MKSGSALLFGLILIMTPHSNVAAQALCFSDAELMSVIVDVQMYSLGQMAGICARRFPDMGTRARDLTQQLENTYRTEFAANDRLSRRAFERAYPGRGKEMRDQNTSVASEPSRKAASLFSRKECEKTISAMEATVGLNDWKLATLFAQGMLRQERVRSPACR